MSLAFESLRDRRLHAPLPWRGTDFSYYLVTRKSDRGSLRIEAFRDWIVGEAADFLYEVRTVLGLRLTPGAGAAGPPPSPDIEGDDASTGTRQVVFGDR